MEDVSFRRTAERDDMRGRAGHVIENFGYRQLLALWRFAAMIELVAGQKGPVDPLERKGFQTEEHRAGRATSRCVRRATAESGHGREALRS